MREKRRLATIWGVIAGTALAVAMSSAPLQAQVREEFHKSYPLSADGHVTLANINGGVKVTAWDKNEVQVDAVKTADTKKLLDEAKIEVNASANSVDIRTKLPENRHYDNHERPAKVEYELHVPRNARLEKIEIVNGGLAIDGVRGGTVANVVNGEINVTNAGGAVKLNSVNGRVFADLASFGKDALDLNTVNGAVEVRLPSNANAEISASTVHGGIANEFDIPVHKGFVGNNLKAKLGDGGTKVNLNAVNGTVKIMRASDGKPLSKVTNLLPEEKGHYF